ncbi:MAG: Abi family protein [Olegusella sp.]|nr:Abi family protein [Olegusella sp.]
MAKEFKTVDELIELMRSRGIQVGGEASSAIRRESYCAIVNGYKGPFIDRAAMRSTSDDVYLEGTTFDQVYALFKFDRDLRCLTFEYLIRAEAIMKNTVAYAFCESFPEHDAYLERSNYAKAKDMLVPPSYKGNRQDLYRDNMAVLMGILNRRVTPNKHMRPFVRHYVDTYGDVPLWVLTNDLTFGNMAHFYQLQRRGVQNRACKLVLEANGNGGRLEPQELLRCFEVLVSYRNLCAHDERLYCATDEGARYRDMISYLGKVLPAREVEACMTGVRRLIDGYSEKLGTRVRAEVLEAMGEER